MGARRLRSTILTAAVVAAALALPSVASADVDVFTVNSNGDATDATLGDNVCATAGAVCTLRAAINEANDNDPAGDTDVVGFDAAMLDQTIQLTAAMDTQDEPISINGCSFAPNTAKPCVGVRGVNTATDGFLLTGTSATSGASGVTFRGLAMTNMDRAITALVFTDGLNVKNNWFGIQVDGDDEGLRMGLDIVSSDAVIGGTAGATGTSPADRNVFANANVFAGDVAVSLFVGDDAIVQGNWFGVDETGDVAKPNDENIEVAGNGTDTAEGVLIGGVQPSPGTCSGPCNVISSADTDGIDLRGTQPQDASGTTIKGNFIGFDASGTDDLGNQVGIRVVNAPDTQIGGPLAGEGNYITGGDFGISANFQGAPGLNIQDNRIGTNIAGTAPEEPPEDIAVNLDSVAGDGALIDNNVIATDTDGMDAIQATGSDAVISGNHLGIGTGNQSLGAGGIGIRTVGLQGSQIHSNEIGGFDLHGITLEGSDDNSVFRNHIGVDDGFGPEGNDADGIRVTDFAGDTATGNTIGGFTALNTNFISANGGDAISVVGDGNDANLIARNAGGQNGTDPEDQFIDLVGTDGPGNTASGPNGGIGPPDLQAARADRSVGLAIPGATVNAFVHQDGENSSLGAFVGLDQADSRGLWVIPHSPAVAPGDGVAHTESTSSGTSELAVVGSGFLDPADPSGPTVGFAAGPSGPTKDSTPAFTLDEPSNDPNFQIILCAVDTGLWEACGVDGSVFTTDALADGPHTVTIMGIDEAANLSAEVTRSFTVDTAAPSTTITKAPKKKVKTKSKKAKLSFSFTSSEPGVGGFECRFGSEAFARCDSGSLSRKLKRGKKHTFQVRAIDAAGNVDATPESRTINVVKKKKKKKKK